MMRIGWSSAKKKVGIGRLIDWLVGIPSLLEFRHCEALKKPKQSHEKFRPKFSTVSSPDLIGGSQY